MATFDEFYAALDPDLGIRGKQFEKFVKWFLKTDPTWASQIDEVWLWNEYPKRWGADCGIDLIFTHKNGKTWAVQSKCVSPNNDIKKSEIDSFLSESSDSKIDGRLLIASTDGIGKNAQQVINRQEKQVVCFLLEQFRKSEIEFPSSMAELNQGKKKEKKTPRHHQIEAIKKVSEEIATTDRGQVLMACGTGKTLTSLWIKEKLKAKQVLVLVPSLSLLSQILKDWNAEANEPFKWICVCSDQSVAKDKSEDEWISNTSEIGVPVTNDTLEIKNFLDESGSKVVFSTYQSSPLIVEAQEHHDTSDFDLIIADEAHRCAGKVSDAFGCVLDNNKIKSNKRLFFTATPKVLSRQLKKSASAQEIQVASMDDHSVFGKVLYQIKFSEAIEDDLLSDYQVVVLGVDDQMIRDQIHNRDLLEISSKALQTDAETLASHIALAKATNEYSLKRVITFHGLVKGAKNFAEDHIKVNEWMHRSEQTTTKIYSEHVSGDMSSGERNKRINRLKDLNEGERRILTNARCLSEGVDVPNLDGIAFIDPRQSQVDIIQAVGRAIRKSENKTFGTIVIPVYLSKISEDINDQVLATKFSSVWKIILALKSQDDSLMEEIDTLRISLGQRRTGGDDGKGIQKVIIDLPEKISISFADKFQTILIKNTSDVWLERFGELKLFVENNGHASPSCSRGSESSLLGSWCVEQRKNQRKNKLSQERIDLLNSITFDWDPKETDWQNKFSELKEFKKKHGHASPSSISKEFNLIGVWCSTQRRNYRDKKLSQEKIDLLNSLDFDWNTFETDWQNNFLELQKFKKKHGHVNPPCSRSSEFNLLGDWCVKQRGSNRKGTLSQQRIDLLNSLDFDWDPKETDWQSNFLELQKFKKKHGHASPPCSRGSESSLLANWCVLQRKNQRKDKLSQERIDLLNSLDFDWDPLETDWQNNFLELQKFKKKHGHASPPTNSNKSNSFGSWCSEQRKSQKKGKLSQERIDLLNSLDFDWDPLETDWQNNFLELQKFKKKHGHASPPTNSNKSNSFGSWCSEQRKSQKKGKLSQERIDLLNSLDFDWDPLETDWQNKFLKLKNFKDNHGHASPSTRSKEFRPLGQWCSNQRIKNRKGNLSSEKFDLLNNIGFKWEFN